MGQIGPETGLARTHPLRPVYSVALRNAHSGSPDHPPNTERTHAH
jgi:hypothetical protein